MQKYEVPHDLLQAVVDYLATRPFREVAGLIPPLMALTPLPDAPQPDAPAED